MANKSMYNVQSKKYNVSAIRVFVFCIVHCTLYLMLCTSSFSQYSKYWIQLTDKNNSPYSVSAPSQFLSARSIQRRQNQGIAVVQNDLPVNPAYYDSIKNVPNVTIINRSKWFNAVTIRTTDKNALIKINSFSFVAQTKPVARYIRETGVEEKLTSLSTSRQSGVEGTTAGKATQALSTYNYGASLNQVDMIGGVCMHDLGFDGAGMHIAVLDAGFYKVDSLAIFASLRANGQILGTWDFVENDAMVYDSHPHGTMVLSTMGGNVPGMIVGTAPKAKYWLLKTEEGATEFVIEEDNWVSGAEFADSAGADILTTSLGYTTYDSVLIDTVKVVNPDNHSYSHMNGNTARISIGTDIAVSKGMFAVCSAGNSGGSPWNFIGAPADADSVLAIGSVDALRNYSWFSSNGPSYDGRVKPNVAAQGQDAVVADPATGGIAHLSGTSFSGPITAGMVACLWQAHPGATNMQLFNAIEQTASRFSNPDTLLGYGISDFCAASRLLTTLENLALSEEVINIYPNPFGESTVIYIQGVNAYGLELNVFDLIGNLVHKETLNAQSLTLNLKLAKGLYMLKLQDGSKSIGTAKLVKY